MTTVTLDENTYTNLIQILNKQYYSTTDISELQKINQIYKALKFKSETWLSAVQPEKSKNKNR